MLNHNCPIFCPLIIPRRRGAIVPLASVTHTSILHTVSIQSSKKTEVSSKPLILSAAQLKHYIHTPGSFVPQNLQAALFMYLAFVRKPSRWMMTFLQFGQKVLFPSWPGRLAM